MIIQRKFKDIKVGDKASISKTITEHDIYTYAGLVGDFNPVHVNEEVAKNTMFGGRIAHGMLIAGFISTVLGTGLPGAGTIYLSQNLKFLAPVRVGDTITAEVEILEKYEEKKRFKVKTTVYKQDGKVVIDGEALVMLYEKD